MASERRTGTGAFHYTLIYDAAGNVTVKSLPTDLFIYEFDAANQATRTTSLATIATFTYDQAGNQTRERNLVYTTTLTWDDENRVKRNRSLVAGGSVSPNTLTYTGDGLLSRLDQYNGTVIKPVWDGQNMLLEQNGSNATQVVYTNQPQLYGKLVSQKRGTAKRYYHYNLIGTTDRLTDASQAVTDSYILEAFGAGQNTSGSTVNPFKFIGELGYYNYQTSALTTATWVRARHYEPIYYRWLSEDLFLSLFSMTNRYLYAMSNPLTYIDPAGLDAQAVARCMAEVSATYDRCKNQCKADVDCDAMCGGWSIFVRPTCDLLCGTLQGFLIGAECGAGAGMGAAMCQFLRFL